MSSSMGNTPCTHPTSKLSFSVKTWLEKLLRFQGPWPVLQLPWPWPYPWAGETCGSVRSAKTLQQPGKEGVWSLLREQTTDVVMMAWRMLCTSMVHVVNFMFLPILALKNGRAPKHETHTREPCFLFELPSLSLWIWTSRSRRPTASGKAFRQRLCELLSQCTPRTSSQALLTLPEAFP